MTIKKDRLGGQLLRKKVSPLTNLAMPGLVIQMAYQYSQHFSISTKISGDMYPVAVARSNFTKYISRIGMIFQIFLIR